MNRIPSPLLSAALVAAALICMVNPAAGADTTIQVPGAPPSSIHFDPRAKVKPADLPVLARISFDDALKAARTAVSGSVIRVELASKAGNLVYSVDVVCADRTITVVDIDAGNGKVFATGKKPGGYENKGD
jgi:Peptidase propeptide and YPEB domain